MSRLLWKQQNNLQFLWTYFKNGIWFQQFIAQQKAWHVSSDYGVFPKMVQNVNGLYNDFSCE